MANIHKFPNTTENSSIAKRKKVIAAVVQEVVTSEDDDNIGDAMEMFDIIENHNEEHGNATSSASAIYSLGKTIRNTLLEINEMREQNLERRHKELLDVLTKMIQHDYNVSIATTAKCNISQKDPLTEEPLKSKLKEEHLEEEQLEHITEEYIVQGLAHDTLIETDDLPNIKTFDDSTINSINMSAINALSAVGDTKQLVNNKKTHNTLAVLKSEKVLNLKSGLHSSSTPSTIKPPIHAIRVVPMKKQFKGDLQKLRAQMLEMQRKKMEDRERKKRELLH